MFTLTLSSSYQSWGMGHLDRDTDEIAECARYVQACKTAKYQSVDGNKLVIMGHSTGSQDILHYLYRPISHTSSPSFDRSLEHTVRPAVDGAIMQAPVSDRECIHWVLKHGFLGRTSDELQKVYDTLLAIANASSREADASHQPESTFDVILPIALTSQLGYPANTPLSARRFLSLVSPSSPASPSEDDLFSSDLSPERLASTFGMIGKRGLLRKTLLVLPSGADQAVPEWVDKDVLLKRWRAAADAGGVSNVWDSLSGPIPGASHALSDEDQAGPRKILVERVVQYLKKVEA